MERLEVNTEMETCILAFFDVSISLLSFQYFGVNNVLMFWGQLFVSD